MITCHLLLLFVAPNFFFSLYIDPSCCFINLFIVMAFVILISVVFLIVVVWRWWRFHTTVKRIPSPPGLPIIGNFIQFLKDPDTILLKVRAFGAKYYPIYRLSVFDFTVVALLEPNDIEIVLSSSKHLTKGKIYDYFKQWLGTGLLTSTGTKWHNRRKILTPAFHFNVLEQFVPIFNNEIVKFVESVEKLGQEPVNVVPLVTSFTLRSIGETAMGFKNVSQENYSRYKKAVYRIGEIFMSRLARPFLDPQFVYNLTPLGCEEKNVVKTLRGFTNDIILEREKDDFGEKTKKKRLAMLDLLLKAKRDGVDIDHDGIREEVDTFMFEGHDTTAMAISFILLTLSNQSEAQNLMAREITDLLGPTKSPTFHDLQALKYTERCIKECLRLFPSVPFISRRAGEDFWTATGYFIPRRTILMLQIINVHYNPVLYPDPYKFDPDRFLPENANGRHPFVYIPFSAGPRNCIGQKFALLELKAALCGILRRFVLEKVDDMFDVQFRPDLVLRPKGEIRVKFKPRIDNY